MAEGWVSGREASSEVTHAATIEDALEPDEAVELIAGVLIAVRGAFLSNSQGFAVLTDRRLLVFSARGGYSMWEGSMALGALMPLARRLLPGKAPTLKFSADRPCLMKRRGQDIDFGPGGCRVLFRRRRDGKAFAEALAS